VPLVGFYYKNALVLLNTAAALSVTDCCNDNICLLE